jgi:uncharacterized protein (DUF736 family)
MNIGQLKKDARGIYMGRVETFALSLTIGLRPVTSNNPAAPKFDVLARNAAGRFVQIGALWEKVASNGTGSFLQGQLDDPHFAEPLSVALFQQPDDTLNVAWSRPKARAASAFDEAPTAPAEDGFAPRNEDFTASDGFEAAGTENKPKRQRKARTPENESDPFANETGGLVPA